MTSRIIFNKTVLGMRELFAVNKVIRSKNLVSSLNVKNFEENFAELIGSDSCIAVNSGTSALHLILMGLGIGPGDEVIVPAFTFAATANTVVLVGAKPVFADIEINTFNIDPVSMQEKITKRTKAIIPVHLFGLMANLNAIKKIADPLGIYVIEDAAQAHGAEYMGQKAGSVGTAAAFSFYGTKNITTGEGGAVTTSNSKLENMIKLLRNQGMAKTYFNELAGFNNRMSEIHAAIGCIQLSRLKSINKRRKKNALFYNSELKGVVCPKEPSNYSHVYHQYVIRVPDLDRNRFVVELDKKGIETRIYYPVPLHKLSYFNENTIHINAEICSASVLAIPVRPNLKEKELHRIVEAINEISAYGS